MGADDGDADGSSVGASVGAGVSSFASLRRFPVSPAAELSASAVFRFASLRLVRRFFVSVVAAAESTTAAATATRARAARLILTILREGALDDDEDGTCKYVSNCELWSQLPRAVAGGGTCGGPVPQSLKEMPPILLYASNIMKCLQYHLHSTGSEATEGWLARSN